MANPLIATSFLVPTSITQPFGGATAANHPPGNIALFTKWRRSWRETTGAGLPQLVFDFGAVTSIAGGIFVNNLNCTLFVVAKSDDNVSYTNIYTANPVPTDDVVNRRKLFIPASSFSSSFNNRYLRLVLQTVVTPNPGYFELGSVAFLPTVTTLTRNFGVPWPFRAVEPLTRSPYAANAGSEVNIEAPDLAAFELQFGPNVKAARAQMLALRGIGQGTPFFFFENRGDFSHAYILERTEEVPWSEAQATIEAPWKFIELV